MWSTWLTAANAGKVLTLHIYLRQSQITLPRSLKVLCLPRYSFHLSSNNDKNEPGPWKLTCWLGKLRIPIPATQTHEPFVFRNCEHRASCRGVRWGHLQAFSGSCLWPQISAAVWHFQWFAFPECCYWNSRISRQKSLFYSWLISKLY